MGVDITDPVSMCKKLVSCMEGPGEKETLLTVMQQLLLIAQEHENRVRYEYLSSFQLPKYTLLGYLFACLLSQD